MQQIADAFKTAWSLFDAAGPLANFLQIAGAVAAIAGIFYAVAFQRIRSFRGRLRDLQRVLNERNTQLDRARADNEKLRQRIKELDAQVPGSIQQKMAKEMRDGNSDLAHRIRVSWLETEADDLSAIFWEEAQWGACGRRISVKGARICLPHGANERDFITS